MGVAGINHPVGWGVYIANFVFWVGIAHSGTLISAILHLVRSKWRTAVSRSAEAMTIFAVMTAGLFPLIHLGRLWVFYYIIPYPSQRQIWPNFISPLVWDVCGGHHVLHGQHDLLLRGADPGPGGGARPSGSTLGQRRTSRRGSIAGWRWAGTARRASGGTTGGPTCSSRPWPRRWWSRCTRWCPGTSPWASCRAGTRRSSRRTSSPGPSTPAWPWC